MPRNGSGTYSLPEPPFTPSTTISSASVNSDLSDIADALTDSLAANGETPLTGPFKFISGTAAVPGITFGSDEASGFYLIASGQVGLSIAGTLLVTYTATGITIAGNLAAVDGAFSGNVTVAGDSTVTGNSVTTGNASVGGTFAVTGIGSFLGTSHVNIPNGTTAERPAAQVAARFRYNSTLTQIEYDNGTAWVPVPVTAAQLIVLRPVTTRQYLKSGTSQTYTTPTGCKRIIVRMISGGGGGGATSSNNGANGTASSFNSITAAPGSGGSTGGGSGGAGGTGGTGSADLRIEGGDGATAGFSTTGANSGGNGGSGAFGGAGRSGQFNGGGQPAKANSGGGGGGGGSTNTAVGQGGGAGEYVEIIIATPAATYTYTVGPGGAGGTAGGNAGGAGGSGLIIVEEYY